MRVLCALAIVAATITTTSADAQALVQVERFRPALDRHGVIDAESGKLIEPLQLDAALFVGYAHNPLTITRRTADDTLDNSGALVGHRVGTSAAVSFGVLDWLAIGLEVPVIAWQSRGTLPTDVAVSQLTSSGLGDVRISPKLRLARAQDFGVDIALLPTITLPTAWPRTDWLGDKSLTFAPELAVSRDVFGVRFVGDLGYRLRQPTAVAGLVSGHEIFYRAALALPLSTFSLALPITVDASIHGALTTWPAPLSSSPLEALLGVQAPVGPVTLLAAAGTGLHGAAGVADVRVVVGVRFSTDLLDSDDDGVDNSVDRCPDVREDLDGLADGDGCPETDADLDGIDDRSDRCPSEPEDLDGFEDADGCPDVDDDADGILDVVDRCPRRPGEAAFGGCRAPDTDGDRIADHLDRCPTEAAPTRDGCPSVVLTAERIEIRERFMFAVSDATVLPESMALCDQVAGVLAAHPELTQVRVEGHTDDTGDHLDNITLSRRRAEAVVAQLVARGVDGARLQALGFGAGRPLVEGTDAAARAQNRRVEFSIVAVTPTAPASSLPGTTP